MTRPLARSMKLLGALFLTISAATPASSVFVIVPDVLSQAGSGALISMAVAAVIAICVAQVYGELGSAFPFSGGEYAIVGRVIGPLSGFMVLGLNLINSLLTTAVLALGVSEYLGAAIPGLQPVPTALVVVIGSTLLGILNIRANALVTGAFVLVEILALIVLAVLGFSHPARGVGELLTHPQLLSSGALSPAPLASVGLAVAVAIFAYDGYGSAVYFGEELQEAPRRIGQAIIAALIVTVLAETVPLTAVLMGAPDLAKLLSAPSIIGGYVTSVAGPGLARALGLGVGLAIINAVIALVLLTSRQLYSTGRDETWPGAASRLMAAVHPRFGSPWAATLTTGALACALCFVPKTLLVIATGTGLAVIYGALCIAVLMGRRNGRTRHAVFRIKGFPVTPTFALIAVAGVLWSDWLDPAEGRQGLFAALGVAAAFAVYFLLFLRKRGWKLKDPEPSPA